MAANKAEGRNEGIRISGSLIVWWEGIWPKASGLPGGSAEWTEWIWAKGGRPWKL